MRPAKHWAVTDTHFNHGMLVTRGYRPAGWQDLFIRNCQRLIAPHDRVIHLGDVILGKNGTLKEIMDQLPGTWSLVRGNHDHESNGWYLRHGFSFVAHGILHGGIWMTHAPQAALPDGAIVNLHGHLHGDEHRKVNLPAHCKLLAIENTDYQPVDLHEFVGFTPLRKSLMGIHEEAEVYSR